jgi:flavin-dependent dehydrogenase
MMNTSLDVDVFVIGGGPAGLAAAISAAQQGLRVAVADCAHPPIDKACGEGLMPDSLEALAELGISLQGCDTGVFRGIRFLGREGSVEGEFPRGRGLGIRRTCLHGLMVDRAAQLGVRLLWGARVSDVRDNAVEVNGEAWRCRWIVGADGQNSRVRSWAGLAAGREYDRRIGLRQHFRIQPWSEFVEIYWGEDCQAYVTPIAAQEICLAVISRQRFSSFDNALARFPELRERLQSAPRSTAARGAITVTRRLHSVVRNNVVLIGEASGSADAITGEGLALSFRQAKVLGEALAANNLAAYSEAHRRIGSLAHLLGRSMLLMDSHSWLRRRALRAFSRRPSLFARLLAVHVGELPLARFGFNGILNLGWRLLTA